MPAPEPPYSTGMHRPEQAGVAERLEEVGRVRALFVDGPRPWLHLVLGEAPDGISELHQLVGEIKIHRRRLPDLPARYFLVLDPRRTRILRAARRRRGPLRVPRRPPGRAAQDAQEGAQTPAPLAAAVPLRALLRRPARRPRGRWSLRLRQLPLQPDQEDPRQAPRARPRRPASRSTCSWSVRTRGHSSPTRPRSRPSATKPMRAGSAAT